MGNVCTFTPRSDAPQAAAIPALGPVQYPALTREQARMDFAFALRACRDHLDALIGCVEDGRPVGEILARSKVLSEGLIAAGRVGTALDQLGDPPSAA